MNDLEQIERFIAKHHLLTLATCKNNRPYCCSSFYAYDTNTKSFIIAGDEKTTHMQNALSNPHVAANIHLETTQVGKIEGLQIEGVLHICEDEALKKLYFKTFPYAKAMRPILWQLTPSRFKLTDNRLGFGKKIILNADSIQNRTASNQNRTP